MSSESQPVDPTDSVYADAIHEYETQLDRGCTPDVDKLCEKYLNCAGRIREYVARRVGAAHILGTAAPNRPAFVSLQDFSHYSVLDLVNWGGNASVHRVTDTRFGREAAVKVPLKDLINNERTLARLQREANLSGRLQHPNIVPIYDVGTTSSPDGEVPWFTMRLIEGQSLSDALAARINLQEDQFRFVLLFRQVCQATGYAHQQGILHRDLKPGNIMLGDYDDAYVMDWGFAKDINAGKAKSQDENSSPARLSLDLPLPHADASITVEMPSESSVSASQVAVLGTPCFLPPEIAQFGANSATTESDVFCLGGILCCILTGAPPFLGDSYSAYHKAHTSDLAEAWKRLDNCGAHAELIILAKDCLNPDPSLRPAHAHVVAARIAEYIREQEEARLEAEREARVSAEETVSVLRRNSRLTLALSLAVVGLVGLIALNYWNAVKKAQVKRTTVTENEVARCLGIATASNQLAGTVELRTLADVDVVLAAVERELQALNEASRIARAGDANPSVIDRLTEQATDASQRARTLQHMRAVLYSFDRADGMIMVTIDDNAPIHEMLIDAFDDALETCGITDYSAIPEAAKAFPDKLRWEIASSLDVLVFFDAERRNIHRETILRLSEGSPEHDFREALYQYLQQESGVEQFDKFLSNWPLERFPKSESLFQLCALACLLHNHTEDAIRICSRGRDLFPDSFAIHRTMAMILTDQEKLSDAEAALRMALAISPKNAEVLAGLGFIEFHQLHLESAARWFEQALAISPQYAWARTQLAVVSFNTTGNSGPARDILKNVLQDYPGYRSAIGWLGVMSLSDGRIDLSDMQLTETSDAELQRFIRTLKEITASLSVMNTEAAADSVKELYAFFPDPFLREDLCAFEAFLRADFDLVLAVTSASRNEATPRIAMLRRSLRILSLIAVGRTTEALDAAKQQLRTTPESYMAKIVLENAALYGGEIELARSLRNELRNVSALAPQKFSGWLEIGMGSYLSLLENHLLGPGSEWVDISESEYVRSLNKDSWQSFHSSTTAMVAMAQGKSRRAFIIYMALCEEPHFGFLLQRVPVALNWLEVPSARLNAFRSASLHISQGGDFRTSPLSDGPRDWIEVRQLALKWFSAEVKAKHTSIRYPSRRVHVKTWAHFCRNCPDFAALRDPNELAKLPSEERLKWEDLWRQVDELLDYCNKASRTEVDERFFAH